MSLAVTVCARQHGDAGVRIDAHVSHFVERDLRAALDRRALPGPQERTIGGRPAYLMASTSGLNAPSSLAQLTAHLQAAAALADSATG